MVPNSAQAWPFPRGNSNPYIIDISTLNTDNRLVNKLSCNRGPRLVGFPINRLWYFQIYKKWVCRNIKYLQGWWFVIIFFSKSVLKWCTTCSNLCTCHIVGFISHQSIIHPCQLTIEVQKHMKNDGWFPCWKSKSSLFFYSGGFRVPEWLDGLWKTPCRNGW